MARQSQSWPPLQPVSGYLQIIEDTTQEAAGMIRQLVAFSRCQAVRAVPMHLNALLLQLEPMLRYLLLKSQALNLLPGPDLQPVEIDPDQIKQVIINLVLNGRDAMAQGGRLTIQTANVAVEKPAEIPVGQYVLLTVRDTGLGMTEGVKRRIFEPFFTTKEVGHGTGLGLSACFGIVQHHQGHMRVESEPGRGSSFMIYLPALNEVGRPSPDLADSTK